MVTKNLKTVVFTFLFGFQWSIYSSIKFSGADGSVGLNSSNSKLSVDTELTFSDGTLKLKSLDGANVSGASNITFGGSAAIATNDHTVFVTGTLVPGSGSTADTITLNNGDVLSASEGNAVGQTVSVAATSTATILGSPVFTGNITLASDSILNLGVNQKLNSSIDLGMGGKVVLLDDLYLKNGVQFINDGTVDCDKSALIIGSIQGALPWTNAIAFQRAYDIRLLGDLALSGVWQFVTDGTDNFSTINGNASMIDLSAGAGGAIEAGEGHTVYLSDVTIKLGTTGGLTFAAGANKGKFVLSNVTFLLTGNYTQTGGEIQAKGDNVRFITGGNKTWTISGSASKFTADGVVVIYETLGGSNVYPFVTSGGGTINFINGATLRSALAESVPVDVAVDAVVSNGSTVTLTNNYELVTVSKINVLNDSGVPKTVTIDGSNYVWRCAGSSIPAIAIADNSTVTLQNVILKNFQPEAVTVGAGSSLRFGDGCVLEIDGNFFDNYFGAFNQIYCTGNVTIRGVKSSITLDNPSTILQETAGKTLTIENVVLYWNAEASLVCSTDTSKITLKDCSVVLKRTSTGDLNRTFATGNIDVVGYCSMRSAIVDSASVTDLVNFNWQSKGLLTVTSGSTLEISKGINFNYAPNITGLSASDQKRRLLLADHSSTLILNNCSVLATTPGMAFDQGTIVANNKVLVTCATSVGNEFEIYTDCKLEILAASILSIDGKLKTSPSLFDYLLYPYISNNINLSGGNTQSNAQLTPYYNAATTKRFALNTYGHVINNCSVVSSGYNKIYCSNGGNAGWNALFSTSALNRSTFTGLDTFMQNGFGTRNISAGVDNNAFAAGSVSPYNVYKWTGSFTSIGLTDAAFVSAGNISNVWAIKFNGELHKYSGSGTTWTQIANIYPRAIAAASDGGLWFLDQIGDLWFRSSDGTLTKDSNGAGFDLIRLSAAGSTTNYKLAALDRNGNLYSAANNRSLELEGIGNIKEVSVGDDGCCAIVFPTNTSFSNEITFSGGHCYIGWIKNCIPGNWPY